MTMFDAFASYPALLIGSVFVLSLLVGSFLNVVIHRLPIMLDREWRSQAREVLDIERASAAGDPGRETAVPEASAEASPAEPGCDTSAIQPSGDAAAIGPVDQAAAIDPAGVAATLSDGSETAAMQPGAEAEAHLAPYNLVFPRSACPRCNSPIKAHQNIPVLSYLWLGGRCASCHARISPRYPIIELVTAVLSAVVAWRFGWHWQTLAALMLTWSLIALAVIDYDHQILPDAITLPLLWLGLVLSIAWHPGLEPTIPVDPASAILGAAAGYLILWLVYWIFRLMTGKEGMGYGDFKLLAAFGAWMGWQMLPLVILVSAVTGAVTGIALVVVRRHERGKPMPFGPFLAAAGWVAMMWGSQFTDFYLRYTGFVF
jgi:leader peptidase (prepilin peptidase) / N-methyltransferase